jgi:Spy/CpxP family protein refolding chaperone
LAGGHVAKIASDFPVVSPVECRRKIMNTLKHLALALTLAAGLSSTILLADPASPTAGEHADKAEKKPRVSRVEKLSTELGLTDEQKASVAALYKEENAALKVITEDKSLERAAKIARNKEIREAHASKIRALLTPEQQAKFDALPKGRGADSEKEGEAHK